MKRKPYKELKQSHGRSYAIGYYVGLIMCLAFWIAGAVACGLLCWFVLYAIKAVAAYLLAENLFAPVVTGTAIIILLFVLIRNNNELY